MALNIHVSASLRSPTHSTVLLWVKKYGHYQLLKPKVNAEDWVILLDESVQFGQNKLLVVYGIRQSDIDFGRPLIFQDLTPLILESRSTWSGQDIKELLLAVQEEIGKIIYAVADYGNSIKKALKLIKIPHVHDLSHGIALIIEHIYKDDPEFTEYTKRLARLRGAQALSKIAHVLPPAQRAKARFMNLKPISDWGTSVLDLLDRPGEEYLEEKDSLAWVSQYKELIMELATLNQAVNDIQSDIKSNGLSRATITKSKQKLTKCKQGRLFRFKKALYEYFQRMTCFLKQQTTILCSSDILESSFGKYKNYLHDNPMAGITNLCLSIPAFTGKLSSEDITNALNNTRVNEIEQWTRSTIGKTTLSKRIEVLKMGREKNRKIQQI